MMDVTPHGIQIDIADLEMLFPIIAIGPNVRLHLPADPPRHDGRKPWKIAIWQADVLGIPLVLLWTPSAQWHLQAMDWCLTFDFHADHEMDHPDRRRGTVGVARLLQWGYVRNGLFWGDPDAFCRDMTAFRLGYHDEASYVSSSIGFLRADQGSMGRKYCPAVSAPDNVTT